MVGIVSQNLPRAALLVEKRAVRNRGDSQAFGKHVWYRQWLPAELIVVVHFVLFGWRSTRMPVTFLLPGESGLIVQSVSERFCHLILDKNLTTPRSLSLTTYTVNQADYSGRNFRLWFDETPFTCRAIVGFK